jgi:hypothetical protein
VVRVKHPAKTVPVAVMYRQMVAPTRAKLHKQACRIAEVRFQDGYKTLLRKFFKCLLQWHSGTYYNKRIGVAEERGVVMCPVGVVGYLSSVLCGMTD